MNGAKFTYFVLIGFIAMTPLVIMQVFYPVSDGVALGYIFTGWFAIEMISSGQKSWQKHEATRKEKQK